MLNRDVLYRGSENSNALIRVGIILIVGLLSLAAGLWLGSTVLDSSRDSSLKSAPSSSQAKTSELQDEIKGLQTDLKEMASDSLIVVQELAEATRKENDLQIQLSRSEAETASAMEDLAEKESELSIQLQIVKEQDNLEALREMSDAIERHRLLLVELRKDFPQNREQSMTYWQNIKTLAARANPALASPADKVILKIDNYFDWKDRSPSPTAPSDEYFDWLANSTISGAAYHDAVATFTKDALLSVITQLDSVAVKLE